VELASQEVNQFGVDHVQGVCPYFLPTSATVYPALCWLNLSF
jgi:hypothetical protein